MTAGQTVILVIGLLAVFWVVATVAVNVWRRPLRPAGRHRATGTGYTPPAADLPPIPHATRRQIRESGR